MRIDRFSQVEVDRGTAIEDYLDFIQKLQTTQAVLKEPDWPRTGHGGDSAN